LYVVEGKGVGRVKSSKRAFERPARYEKSYAVNEKVILRFFTGHLSGVSWCFAGILKVKEPDSNECD
jgi:hypothetical protein